MTADEPTCCQPGASESAMPPDRLERVLGAGWREAAAGRKCWRHYQLVAADESGQGPAGDQEKGVHRSVGREHCFAPGPQLRPERIEARGVGFAADLDDQIPGRLPRLDILAPDLPQPPAQTIAGHRG